MSGGVARRGGGGGLPLHHSGLLVPSPACAGAAADAAASRPAASPPPRGTAGTAGRLPPTRGVRTPAPPAAPPATDVAVAGEASPIATVGWGDSIRRYLPPTPAATAAADNDGGRFDAAVPVAAIPTRPVTPSPPERVACMTGWVLLDVAATLSEDVVVTWLMALGGGLCSLPGPSRGGCWLSQGAAVG